MYRPTKVSPGLEELPNLTKKLDSGYVTLYNKFGPWISDDYQHVILEESTEAVEKQISESYTENEINQTPKFFHTDISALNSFSHKYIIYYKDEFFHFVINNLVVMLYIYNKDPRAEFIVLVGEGSSDGYQWKEDERKKNLEFLESLMKLYNIPVYILNSELAEHKYSIYSCKNVSLVNDFLTTVNLSLAEICHVINKYILDKYADPLVPGRKIYISRESNDPAGNAFVEAEVEESGYITNATRVHEEPKLEEYLKSEGFEIVKPSQLDSMEKQIKLFSSAEVLVGATGTGLTNVLFMRDGQSVIELRVEIKWSTGDHGVNNHYLDFSYGKGHTYTFVDVSDKQVETAITKLNKIIS